MKITSNAGEVAARLESRIALNRAIMRKVVNKHSLDLLAKVKANANLPASGPPGPRNQTGDYNRSWNVRFSGNANTAKGTVGTNKPQARRLEYGFTGVDSLGRHYAQPPYPHLGPAFEEEKKLFLDDLSEALKRGQA